MRSRNLFARQRQHGSDEKERASQYQRDDIGGHRGHRLAFAIVASDMPLARAACSAAASLPAAASAPLAIQQNHAEGFSLANASEVSTNAKANTKTHRIILRTLLKLRIIEALQCLTLTIKALM